MQAVEQGVERKDGRAWAQPPTECPQMIGQCFGLTMGPGDLDPGRVLRIGRTRAQHVGVQRERLKDVIQQIDQAGREIAHRLQALACQWLARMRVGTRQFEHTLQQPVLVTALC